MRNVRKKAITFLDAPPPEALQRGVIAETKLPVRVGCEVVLKRTGLHVGLYESGKISLAAMEWVERYARALEIRDGGSDGKSEVEPVDSQPLHFYPRQIQAQTFIRISEERMTRPQIMIVQAACVQAWRISDVAEKLLMIPRRVEMVDGERVIEHDLDYKNRVSNRVRRETVAAIKAGAGCS